MPKKRVFIFDLDGTLVDAYQAIAKSLNFTRNKLGYPKVGFKKIKHSVGGGDRLFSKMFFDKEDTEDALRIYRRHHRRALLKFSKLKPNAKKVLSSLKTRKKILAIASNRPKHYTDIILKTLGIKKYFKAVCCADQIKSLKPNPKILNILIKRFEVKKADTVYIGDMGIDLETAKRAKIDAVFMKNGSSTLDEVKKYKNKKVISNLSRLLVLYN
jgi:phosphoglycolate phosphatase